MAQPGQEAALQLLRPAQRRGLLVGQPGLLALQRQPQRVGGVLQQRGGVRGLAAGAARPTARPASRGPASCPRRASWPAGRWGRPARRTSRPGSLAGRVKMAGHAVATACGQHLLGLLQQRRGRHRWPPGAGPARRALASARHSGGWPGRWVSSATSSACRPWRSDWSARPSPSADRDRPGQRLQHLPDRLEHPVARGDLIQQPVPLDRARRVARVEGDQVELSRCGPPVTARKTVMTPRCPPGPMTGTDQELATFAAGRQRAERRPGAARPDVLLDDRLLGGGRQADRAARRAEGQPGPCGLAAAGGRPSDAAQTSACSALRWMHSRSLPSAAPSADRISDRLDDGSADTRRSASPCSRVSWRRAEESTCWPDSSASDVVGVHLGRVDLGDHPAVPQHHDPVGEPEHLVDVVAGQQDRGALLAQAADQLLDLGGGPDAQRGGRLVEQQQPRAGAPSPGRPRPAGAGRRTASGRSWWCRAAGSEAAEQRGRLRMEADVGHQAAAALAAEQQVRRDVQVVAERQVLPDHGDALAGPRRPGRG